MNTLQAYRAEQLIMVDNGLGIWNDNVLINSNNLYPIVIEPVSEILAKHIIIITKNIALISVYTWKTMWIKVNVVSHKSNLPSFPDKRLH